MVSPHPPSPVHRGGDQGFAVNRTMATTTSTTKKQKLKKRVRISEAAPTVACVEDPTTVAPALSPLSAERQWPVGALQVDDDGPVPTTTTASGRSSFSPPPPLSDQERSDAWWSATDFAAVKESVKRQCRDHRRDRRYSDCLTEAYRSACTLAAATTAALSVATSEPHPASLLPSCDDDAAALEGSVDSDGSLIEAPVPISTVAAATRPNESLVRWVCDEGPRGLEVYSSRLHALRRQRHLQESKHAVLGEQARQRHRLFLEASSCHGFGSSGGCVVDSGSCNDGDEVLARRAAHASHRARTFAALLGQADAWVAHRHLHDNDHDGGEELPSTDAIDEPPEVTEESSPSSCDA